MLNKCVSSCALCSVRVRASKWRQGAEGQLGRERIGRERRGQLGRERSRAALVLWPLSLWVLRPLCAQASSGAMGPPGGLRGERGEIKPQCH